tara:strand:+ start:164 stop:316 length:153 start_codon:yes stop_codon:yes gene_type:complete
MYKIEKDGDDFLVINERTDEVMGVFGNLKSAQEKMAEFVEGFFIMCGVMS